ncbi:MAG: tetratricopeptide repeat protein [Planctomycetota bacterium]
MAGIYYYRGMYDKALEYFEKTLAIRSEVGDRQGEGVTLWRLTPVLRATSMDSVMAGLSAF